MNPDEVVGTPAEKWIWLSPDWTKRGASQSAAGPGSTRVLTRTITYRDGRVIEYVVDANGQIITHQTLTETTNPEIKDKWDKDKAAQGRAEDDTRPPNGRTEIVVNGQRMGWNPQTRAYDVPLGAAPATGTQPQRPQGGKKNIEGTPTGQIDANGQPIYDNERPRWVIRDEKGNEVWSEPLTGKDLDDWRESRERSRNPGGKTDAQVATETAKDDTVVVDVSYTGTGKARQKVTTYKSGRKVTEAAPEQARATSSTYENRDGKPVKVTKYDDGTETVEEQKPTPGQVIKGGGPNGEDVQAVTGPDGRISYQPIPGATNPNAPEPAGAPTPSFTIGDAAKDLTSYQQWLNEQVRAGRLTTERADKLLEARRQLWATAISEQSSIVNAQQNQQSAAITQRGQTLQDLGNRRTSAVSLSNQASSDWMPLATKLGANANGSNLLSAIDYARQSANNFVTMTGANREVPEVQPGPALAAVNGMGIPGSVTMPQTPAFLAGRANPLGVGAIGATPAPQPIASTMPPIPPVGAASELPQPGDPAPLDPAAAAAQAAADQALTNALPPAPPVNPPAGEPGNDPSLPVGMQAPPTFMARMRPNAGYNPQSSIQRMIADPNWDNQAVAQAARELYGIDLGNVA